MATKSVSKYKNLTRKSSLQRLSDAKCKLALMHRPLLFKNPTEIPRKHPTQTCKLAAVSNLPEDQTERIDVSTAVCIELVSFQRIAQNLRRQVAYCAHTAVGSYVNGVGYHVMPHGQP